MFFNSGIRGARARDGVGSIASKDQYVQKIEPVPSITSYAIQGSDDQALDPAGGQTVVVTGTGFAAGLTGIVGGTNLASVTVVSPYQATFTSPAAAPGSYTLILSNSSGTAAIYVPGLTYSSVPTYTTAAGSIGTYYETTAVSTQVVATSDSAITYSLASGALPSGTTLYANGVITGSAPVDSSSTTYSFSITATDAELQDVTRSFTLTINTDVVTWSSPGSGTTYTVVGNTPISNVTLSATSAAGYGVTYAANALPTGLTLSSGVISGTPTVEANTTSLLTATASTTNRSATNTIYWVVTLNDAYFKYNSLLMSSTVVTNTFATDLSSNNLDITIVGDTKPSKFDPFEPGYYSAYFDGNGDSLSAPANSAFQFTGDYTIEFWIYFTSVAGTQDLVSNYVSSGSQDWTILISPTFQYYPSSAASYVNGPTPVVNRWYHVAAVRSGTTCSLYIDGVSVGTPLTFSGTLGDATRPVYVGSRGGSSNFTNGYISNVRVVKGTAVYTSNFTPSTTPLTAIANTSLLTCQSNRFIDTSANAFAITVNGNTAVNPFQPFTPNNSYATYGSTYFDGTGDYLTTATTPAFANLWLGNVTVECWVYFNSVSSTPHLWSFSESSSARVTLYVASSVLKLYTKVSGEGDIITSATTLNTGRWYHVAITRNSGTWTMWLDGVSQGTSTSTNRPYNVNEMLAIGTQNYSPAAGDYLNGYVSNFRVVSNTAVYTSNFTPSTTPLTVITNTSLLTCQTVVPQTTSVFVDESGQNNSITRNGNTNIGTFSPLNGSWSNYFDGTSDYLGMPTSSSFNFGTGDFTVECWVNWSSTTTDRGIISRYAGASSGWALRYDNTSGPTLNWINGDTSILIASHTPITGTWYHYAVCRSGTTLRIFINGTQSASTTYSGNQDNSSSLYIGSLTNSLWFLNGYISNVRILKGTALYTAAFTPPTAPLNSIANTSLLTCNSPGFVDYSPVNNVITRNGDTAVNKFSPFPGYITNFASYSGFFDGTGDYLSVPSNAALQFGTENFTTECWFYLQSSTSTQCLYDFRASTGSTSGFFVGIVTSGYIQVWNGTNIIYYNAGITIGQWYHLAIVRNSGTITAYLNGTSVATASNSTNWSDSVCRIGSSISAGENIIGYISNLRVVKGTAVYTATFTPSTTPLTAISGTSLLTCQSTTFIDNSANAFAITVAGNTKPVIQNPFANTFTSPVAYSPTTTGSSMYFDGTGDYASYTGSLSLNGAFTVECWFYNTSTSGVQQTLFAFNSTSGSYASVRVDCDQANTQFNLSTNLSTSGSSWQTTLSVNNAYVKSVWNHVAVSRDSSNLVRLFLNGVVIASGTQAGTLYNTSTTHGIGINSLPGTPTNPFQGYISNLRMVAGTALYTAPFVPSSSPLPAVQNTIFLVSSTITPSVYDAAEISDIENVGNSKLTASNSPYYSSYSGYFDGTGDYLTVPSNAALQFGTGDFTIEGWIYPTSPSGDTPITASYQTWATSVNFYFALRAGSPNVLIFRAGDSLPISLVGNTSVPINTWTHVAVARSSGVTKIFVNGVVQTATHTGSVNISATALATGIGASQGGLEPFTGYISNLRMVKGTAVYTATFTPPTAPLTAIANTSLLTCQSNRFIDNSTNAFTITRNGDTKISALQPFGGSNLTKYSSVYFDGTGDYLNMLQNPVFALRSDYTIEAWVYRTDSGVQRAIVDLRGGGNLNILFYMNTSNQLAAFNSSTTWITSTGTVPLNQWAYVAISRSGTSVKLFINGVNDGTATNSDLNVSVGPAYIGRQFGSTSNDWMGYISDVRITNGYARYTTTFTPPTVPLLGF